MADPVEKALDKFQDTVLSIWEKTAGAAFDKMVQFEEAFGTAVGLFSFAAWGKDMSAVPQLFKAVVGVELEDVTNVMMAVGEHIISLVALLKGLLDAFASKIFETFVRLFLVFGVLGSISSLLNCLFNNMLSLSLC